MRNLIAEFRNVLLAILKPFLMWASGKHLPFTHKGVTGRDYYRLYESLTPGCVFVTKTRGELTSLIIPGYWNHAAIYAPAKGDTIDELVIEAEGPGVVQTDLVSFLTSKDEVMVLRPYVSQEVMDRAAKIARGLLGLPYDYAIGNGDKAFYCSRVVFYSYEMACKEFDVENPYQEFDVLGEGTISPDNISRVSQQSIFYDSRRTKEMKSEKSF